MTTIESPPPPAEPAEPAAPRSHWRVDIPDASVDDMRPVKWMFYLALVGLAIGAAAGFLQAFERLDVNLYDAVGLDSYYQGLTLHGVTLALVLTFNFASSFMSLTTMRGFGRPLASRALSWAACGLAWAGVVLAAAAMLSNKATVLFTFYPPLQAAPIFYVGAVLLVVSTWVVLLNQILTYREWRKDRPVERIPLLAYVSMLTFIMWFIASLGIAIEVLVFVLPWSLGWREAIDPQLARTLFWFTGHPIVYFWLLPVYVSWYMMLPRMCGGRIFSDGLTRVVFIAFLLLIPVGVHHQFTDPGIPFSSKTIMWILTVCIFMPSVATAFSIIAGLEEGGRKAGGKGLLGWVWKLPWGNPAVSGQLLAGLVFMLGGASGFINASYTVNLQVHNTAFIPGHFHLTVGTGVALSIMAISYWLVPYFTGKQLFARGLAVFQTFLWVVGVLTFSRGQMWGGTNGMPRRTQISDATYLDNHNWDWANILTGIGGTIMVLSSVLFFVVIIGTIYSRRLVSETQRIPVVEVAHGPRRKWVILDNLWLWVGITLALVALVYGEVFWHYLPINEVSETGFQLW